MLKIVIGQEETPVNMGGNAKQAQDLLEETAQGPEDG